MSILAIDANPNTTNQVAFEVNFDASVTGVNLPSTGDPGDFQIESTGLTDPSFASLTGSGSSYVVTLNTGVGEGTLKLNLIDDDSILDGNKPLGGSGTSGNRDGSFLSGETYTVDNVVPTIVAIQEQSPSLTNQNSIDFVVQFSEAVVGVAADDFELTTTGLSGASISSITGSADHFTVSVNTGVGNGTIMLSAAPTATITDLAGNAVSSAQSSGVVTIDRSIATPLTATVIGSGYSSAQTVQYQVSFAEPMVGVQAENFELFTTGPESTIAGMSVTQVDGSGADYTLTLDTGTGDGLLYLRFVNPLSNVTDLAGNVPETMDAGGSVWQIDRTAPTVVSVQPEQVSPTNSDLVPFLVTFSAPINNFSTADIAIVASSMPNPFVQSIESISPSEKRVWLSVLNYEGTVTVSLLAGQTLTDLAGHQLAADSIGHPAYTVDTRFPTLDSSSLVGDAPIDSGTFAFQVVFDSQVTGVDVSDFLLSTRGDLSARIDAVSGSGNEYFVTGTVLGGTGTLQLFINDDNTIVDAIGNPFTGVGVGPGWGSPSYEATFQTFALTATIETDSLSESAGPAATNVVVSHDLQTGEVVDVLLSSSDTSELQVPASVSIPAGQQSISVPIDVIDDSLFDGTQTVTVTASTLTESSGGLDRFFGDDGFAATGLGMRVQPPTAAIAVQEDGKIVAVAEDRTLNQFSVSRMLPDGSPDPSFGTGGLASIAMSNSYPVPTAVLIQPDGKIVVGGKFGSGTLRAYVVRFNADGTPDSSFGNDGIANVSGVNGVGVSDLAFSNDGSILASLRISGTVRLKVLRVTADGLPDTSFGPSGIRTFDSISSTGTSIKSLPNGDLLIAGSISGVTTLVKTNSEGVIDESFGESGVATIDFADDFYLDSIEIDHENRIVLGGTVAGTLTKFGLARVMPDGALDSTFGLNGLVSTFHFDSFSHTLTSFHITESGKIVSSGYAGGTENSIIVTRHNGDGSLDQSFTGDGSLDYQASVYSARRAFDSELDANENLVVLSGWGDDFRVARINLEQGFISAKDSVAVLDDEAPSVIGLSTSDLFLGEGPLGNGSLEYQLTFDTPVIGVDSSDFSLLSGGVTGASIVSITPDGLSDTFTVTVDAGQGDGTLQLVLDDDDSIVGGNEVSLGGSGLDNGSFTDSTVVTVVRNPVRTITGVIFDDLNDNGVRDVGEPPAILADIFLDIDGDGNRDLSEPRQRVLADNPELPGDQSGVFTFNDVPLGTYGLVVEDNWSTYVSSPDFPVTVELGYGDGPLVVDVPAQKNNTAVRGVVFEDLNQNGVQDTGEPGIEGQRLYRDSNLNQAFDSYESNAFSASDGTYEIASLQFDNVPPDSEFAVFRFDPNDSWFPTTDPVTTRYYDSIDQVEVFNLGLVANQTQLSGTVFEDQNGDGLRDVGDDGLEGWIVFLDENLNGVRDPAERYTVSDAATGAYQFDRLDLGYHRVTVEHRPGWAITSQSSQLVELTVPDSQAAVDFAAHINLTKISGTVYADANGNGIQDQGETAFAGATAYVDVNNNGQFDPGEPADTSAADGSYEILDVLPGQTRVRILLAQEAEVTSPRVEETQVYVMHGSNQIQQVDPTTGIALRDNFVTGPLKDYVADSALAFDGEFLYAAGYYNGQSPGIIKIDPLTFETVEQKRFYTSNSPPDGAAVIGDTLYLMASIDDTIYAYDLETLSPQRTMRIDDLNANSGYSSAELDLFYSLGESADGTNLIARNASDNVLVIDPQTGLIQSDFPIPPASRRQQGLAGVNGEVYITHDAPSYISTLDGTGNVLQSETLDCIPGSAAAGVYIDTSHRLDLSLDQQSTGNDFGIDIAIRTVSGQQFLDSNRNGILDPGESPLAGILVYADLNENGLPDSAEPSAVSGIDGSYVLENVPRGDLWIRRDWPSSLTPSSVESSVDLVIASNDVSDPADPDRRILALNQYDPITGESIGVVQTQIESIWPNRTTTDGRYLYTIDNTRKVLIQLTPQGGLVREIPVPMLSTGGIPYSQGPAVINDTVYWITGYEFKIRTVDPRTGELTNERPITIAPSMQSTLSSVPPSGVITESPDGNFIWMFVNQQSRVLVLDPTTAEIIGDFDYPFTAQTLWSASTFNDEVYLRNQESNGDIWVFDQNQTLVRELDTPYIDGFVVATFDEFGTPISGTTDVLLDHGYLSLAATISGVVGNDTNSNGVIEAGETTVAGATVFLDVNGNGWPDSGEASVVTGTDGAYTFEDISPGSHQVSVLPPVGYRASDVYTPEGRLFGVELYQDSNSPTGLSAEFWEFDPQDGDVLQHVLTDIPLRNGEISLAFDGTRLLLVDNADDMIYQLTTDGQLISSLHLGELIEHPPISGPAYSPVDDLGPAFIGGSVFTVRRGVFGSLTLAEYDVATNQFIGERPVTLQYPVTHAAEAPYAVSAVTESIDGQSILIGTSDDQWFDLDPVTAIATFAPAPQPLGALEEIGAATLGQELFVADTNFNVSVFNDQSQLLRSFAVPHRQYSLAAGEHRVAKAMVNAGSQQDFSVVSTRSNVSGTVFVGGAPGAADVEVYLDLNQNGMLDQGEPTQITDQTGAYTFGDVLPGEYVVNVVPPENTVVSANTNPVTELFAYIGRPDANSVIQQLDPKTGKILNEFPSPYPQDQWVGLAADMNWLFLVRNHTLDFLSKSTGQVERSIALPIGFDDGLAVLGNRAFVSHSGTDAIAVVDLARQRIDAIWDLSVINEGVPGNYDIDGVLSESANGNELLVGLSSGDVLAVDPFNGSIRSTFANINMGSGAAGAGGEWFEFGFSQNNQFVVYDVRNASGEIVRRLPVFGEGSLGGLAAIRTQATTFPLRVKAEIDQTNVDFNLAPSTRTVTGIQFLDANENQTFDAGDSPLEGLTVFADYNGNGHRDAGEPFAVSDATGAYAIENVPFGFHIIDTEPTPGSVPVAIAPAVESIVGVSRVNGPTDSGYVLELLRIFPGEYGTTINSVVTETEVLSAESVTQIGNRLLVVDNGRRVLLQVALDGSLVSETPLPQYFNGGLIRGYSLAVIDQTPYLLGTGAGVLMRFDMFTQQLYGARMITAFEDPSQSNPLDLSTTMTESIDGKSLVVFSRFDDRVFVIDPKTARITSVKHVPVTDGWVYSAAIIGNQYAVTAQSFVSGRLMLDENFDFVESSDALFSNGLTGGSYLQTGTPLLVSALTPTVLNQAHRSTHGIIAGVVRRDINGDGIVDTGETVADAVVFLDTNGNDLQDPDEAWTQTDAGGGYSFDSLLPGDYRIRVVSPDRVIASEPRVELFSIEQPTGSPTVIHQHDPYSGSILRTFDAPGIDTSSPGLALDDHGLYYSTREGVWMLDRITGATKAFIELPQGNHGGMTVLGGDLYVLDRSLGTITRIDVEGGSVVQTLDIDALNQDVQFTSGNLSTTLDGTRLYTRNAFGVGYIIDPETGIVEERLSVPSGGVALASAAGEFYSSYQNAISVETLTGLTLRFLGIGYQTDGLAADLSDVAYHTASVYPDAEFANLDFQLVDQRIDPITTLSGTVWQDDNRNGNLDSNELGLAGQTVYLDLNGDGLLNTNEPTQTTADDDPATPWNELGTYQFTELAPGQPLGAGSLIVRTVVPPSWQLTAPSSGDHAVSLSLPTIKSGLDFGLAPQHSPSDILLSQVSVNENTDTSAADLLFATLSALDQDPNDSHTFELVSGNGDADNTDFLIDGNGLRFRQNTVLDYEFKPSYSIRVRVTDTAGLSFEKAIQVDVNNLIEIDKADVTINDGSGQRSQVQSVTVEFDTDVILEDGAITVHRRGTNGGLVGTIISPSSGTPSRTFVLAFEGAFAEYGSLVDGNFELRVDAAKIVSVDGFGLDANRDGLAGDDFVFGDQESDQFFRFYGDVNGDRSVNGTDFLFFRGTYAKSSGQPGFDDRFDYNQDGTVNGTDYLYFRGQYGKKLLF
ncbi:SdrD B-like domain-containing protein [Rhodopirellula sp. MGV]|uniref:SdrD B-like domain-containing protein n=1 Tax=Rhodopirellula sp. MGV TaxID=2023130 RepID=UPI0013042AFF|nr:SdrD B-like domain-containing protein [Rhodopirellula sp. MGV]